MVLKNTVAAISTPQGMGGIGVIRLSGPDAQVIADAVFAGHERLCDMPGYRAVFGLVHDGLGVKIDECVATNFIAPKSFTGENTVELSCHGGPFVLRRTLSALLAAGAVPAGPGEFTKRAFLNGKLDLTKAEAVMNLISASGEKARIAAISGKDGALSKKIDGLCDSLLVVGSALAAWADYPDDDVPQIEDQKLQENLITAESEISALLTTFDSGRILREGVDTVIAGSPNAGKSTLMNLLAGCERSIVTPVPGTTRDVVEESVMLGDIPLRLSDTAGIRDTSDPVEQIGVRIARQRVDTAELVFAVFDASQELSTDDRILVESLRGRPGIAVVNKTDLEQKIDCAYIDRHFKYTVYISALNGEGVEGLTAAAQALLGTAHLVPGEAALYSERQRDAARRALLCIQEAAGALASGLTLDAVTVSVESAIAALLELTGQRTTEAVVDQVFARFCVGK